MTTMNRISLALLIALPALSFTAHGQDNKAALDAARSNLTAHTARAASLMAGRSPKVEEAIAEYEAAVAIPDAPNKAKIAAFKAMAEARIRGMAGLDLNKMDIGQAHAILRRALALPGLKPDEQAEAWQNIAKLYERQDLTAEARAAYDKMQEVNPAKTPAGPRKSESAAEIRAACLLTLNNPAATPAARWSAFKDLPSWTTWRTRDFAALRADCETWLPAFMAVDTNRAMGLVSKIKEVKASDPSFVAWAAPLALLAPKLEGADYVLVRNAQLGALAALGKTKELVQAAESMAKDGKLPAPVRFQGSLTAAAFKGGGADMKKIVAAAAKAFKPEELPHKEKSDVILEAARVAMAGGQEQAARGLYAAYEAFFAQLPRASTPCAFMGKAVEGGAYTAKLDRPYGDNLKFLLETDAAVTGRNIGPEAGTEASGDNVTDFYTACDREGVHFFFRAHDSKVDEVLNGFVTGGSYEGYFAAGSNQPYSFFNIGLPGGDFSDTFDTMYPNRQFRSASRKNGLAKSETRVVDKGFVTHLFYDWEAFYDKLPANGDAWQFENIRWTRAGGLSFGGSQSVHNRSSWGDIVFSGLTPENLSAIKRRLVFKAAAKYRLEGRPSENGVIDFWRDAQLGDPEFYRTELKPLVDTLDEYAKKVGKEMSVADVDTLFANAVPGWMEIRYLAAERRQNYLDRKRMAGE